MSNRHIKTPNQIEGNIRWKPSQILLCFLSCYDQLSLRVGMMLFPNSGTLGTGDRHRAGDRHRTGDRHRAGDRHRVRRCDVCSSTFFCVELLAVSRVLLVPPVDPVNRCSRISRSFRNLSVASFSLNGFEVEIAHVIISGVGSLYDTIPGGWVWKHRPN